ncbi:hypothetical protein [Streptomyces doebereineriae]|uniref:Serine/arginine repetitive matrix protein 2 n=1 Tax=Streptomyces doebereineriae TaxID=3075528 RepID=A0ABU2VLC0_9ACTN|nr:hypothetical protein [Streptomyces sp. DSM 41640]MDT0486401.1 hypothetical protein [Streptomyces sp. DSM 41640]
MSGGVRYWNEETQRWEDGDGSGTATGPVTPPPPARPGAVPTWPPGVPGAADGASDGAPPADGTATPAAGPVAPVWPPAAGSAGAEAAPDKTVDAAAGSGSTEPSAEAAPVLPPPPSPPAGWPGTGGGSTWHGPGAPDGGWSSVEQLGGGSAPSAEWSGTSWSTAAQTAAPTAAQTAVTAPPTRTNRRLLWSVLGGVAAVGVAVTLMLTLVGGGDEDDKAGDPSPAPTGVVSQQSGPYESPTPSPTEDTASPLASAPELPAGYELYEDEEGFRIARPAGWSRTTVTSKYGIDVVNYRSADGERRLQVYQVAEESPEASFELYLSAETTKPDGFEQLDLQPVEEDGFTGERLEYRADSLSGEPDVGPWHVYDERFVAQDGLIYAIAAYGLENDGSEDELELLTTALSGFCAPYSCDAASID